LSEQLLRQLTEAMDKEATEEIKSFFEGDEEKRNMGL